MNQILRLHLLPALLLAAALAAPASSRPTAPLVGYTPPVANAGPDQVIGEDQPLALTGAATGTEPLDYWWDLGDGRGFSVNSRLVSDFDYDAIGTFVATLRVTDLWDGVATDQCTITILPRRHCTMTAAIAAQPNEDKPWLGAWRYRITVIWGCTTYRPGTNLYFETFWRLDPLWSTCGCGEFGAELKWEDPAGASLPDCVVDYRASLLCDGAPVLGGGGGGRLIGMVPVARTCAGDPDGSASLDFYSDYPPETRAGVIAIWEEEANVSHAVEVAGPFPGLPCSATPARPLNWGTIKALYR